MRVLVLGGTGFLGSALVPLLATRGHEVTVLSRSREATARLAAMGAKLVQGDLAAPRPGLAQELGGVDAIVLIAAPRLFGKRLGDRRFRQLKEEISAIHVNALELARSANCPIVITGGVAFRTTGDEVADETWPLVRSGATAIGEDLDPMVARFVAAGGPKLVWMLPGQIYGPGGMFLKMLEMAKKGRGAVLGDGRNCIPRIHVDDCAAAYVAALEHLDTLPTGERFIVADDTACTSQEFADELARLLGKPPPKGPPAFVVKLILGRRLFETATAHCRVTNAKAKRVLGWSLRHPSYREGLAATVKALEAVAPPA